MQPRVSVIIASCNHERFLGRAVESVLDQTLQDFEILVADDGSTDGSADVVRGFRDPRIRSWLFPHNRHQHPRNHCLDHARGEFVAILNSDDAFHPDKLEKQVRHLEAHPATGVVFSWIEPIDERGARIADSAAPIRTWFQEPNRPRHAWLRRLFEGGNHLCHPTAMMRRQLVDEVGRYHPLLALASDLDLWLRLALRAEFHVIPEPLTAVRLLDGEGNASGDRPAIQRRALFELAKALRRLAGDAALPQLPLVFPELAGCAGRSPAVCRHALAVHAMAQPQDSHKMFGLDLAYELLADRATRTELVAALGPEVLAAFQHATAHANPLRPWQERPAARVHWVATEGGAEEARDLHLRSGQRQCLVLANLPLQCGVRPRLVLLDRPGIVRLETVVLREEAGGTVLYELSLPRDAASLDLAGSPLLLLPRDEKPGLLLACLAAHAPLHLPAVPREVRGHLRLEVTMEPMADWQILATVLARPERTQNAIVSAASRLLTSLVRVFSRASKASTSPSVDQR